MTISFADKYGPWALVTGASKGLGTEFAHQCAKRGLNTILVARSGELLDELAGQIKEEYKVEVQTIALDLSRPDILDVITPVTDSLEVGLLINNAGISRVRPFLEHSMEQLLTQLNLNTRAAMILAYHFGHKMAKTRRGGIIFLSSGSAKNGTPFVANYAGTKAYNLILGESLWYELGSKGIDVLGFMPGSTKTPGWDLNKPKVSSMVKVMGASETVTEALDALGKHPSWLAGRVNRIAYFIMDKLMTRSQSIRTVGKSMKSLFGPFQ
jgi:short-subunit dehydrogenase